MLRLGTSLVSFSGGTRLAFVLRSTSEAARKSTRQKAREFVRFSRAPELLGQAHLPRVRFG